jgi:hypothetical protein
MALLTSGLYTVDLIDFAKQTQQHSLFTVTPTAGNLAAQIVLRDAYDAALTAITEANVYKNNLGLNRRNSPPNPSLTSSAGREKQWGVIYSDPTTGQTYTFRIAAPIQAGNMTPVTNFADLTATDIAAYVAALEAFAISPNGNAIKVSAMISVGKNDRNPKFP